MKANYGILTVTDGDKSTDLLFMDFFVYGLQPVPPAVPVLGGLIIYSYASFEDPDNVGMYQTVSCQAEFQDEDPDEDEWDENPVVTNYYGSNSFEGNANLVGIEKAGELNAGDVDESGPWSAANDDKENVYASERLEF